MVLPTYPGKIPQTSPNPQKKEFLHKLLVKHPGYLPGVCGWDLRFKQSLTHLPPKVWGGFCFSIFRWAGPWKGRSGRRDLVTLTASMEEFGFLRRCVMNAALKCGRSTLVSLAPIFFSISFGDYQNFLVGMSWLLLMEEILHQLIGSLSHYLQGFYTFQGV